MPPPSFGASRFAWCASAEPIRGRLGRIALANATGVGRAAQSRGACLLTHSEDLMRVALVLALALVTTTACGPRQVEVRSEPASASDATVTLHITNNLGQAVNVYVVTDQSNVFVKQLAANTTEDMPVRGVAAGTSVKLRATTADGTRTFTSDAMTLSSTTSWRVP
jgi:hypothetical protein